eukprot:SAG31_NODE_4344_length_3330_cov_1.716496_5_plen_147_part_00
MGEHHSRKRLDSLHSKEETHPGWSAPIAGAKRTLSSVGINPHAAPSELAEIVTETVATAALKEAIAKTEYATAAPPTASCSLCPLVKLVRSTSGLFTVAILHPGIHHPHMLVLPKPLALKKSYIGRGSVAASNFPFEFSDACGLRP